ncbi:glycosyltransferase [Reichenbachiella sp. MALMAid0571]|uniref:glycosyltransferase n=1 Tax=Reichenbachiella sp. MALMAid0571 TaxID=3143939 RepID=UPI0032DF2B67
MKNPASYPINEIDIKNPALGFAPIEAGVLIKDSMSVIENKHYPDEILFITSYPPRACGIATYSKDLMDAIGHSFDSFSLKVCALEEGKQRREYPDEVRYTLNANDRNAYADLAGKINRDPAIKMVFVQHEFGLYGGEYGDYLLQLLYSLEKPIAITFHTVLPNPDDNRKKVVQAIARGVDQIVVMTRRSAELLQGEYGISTSKISLIPHGTHIVMWRNKRRAKQMHQLEDRLILSTFGLLGRNKSIETALEALPKIVGKFPNVMYLVLGKTHPGVVDHEGESYRRSLEGMVEKLGLKQNVRFVDRYLELSELLEFLSLTDIYLFTSKDPNQAVSGTFAYAMSSACPVISTPIPHATEMLQENSGILVGFQDSSQLADAAIRLLENDALRKEMGRNAFHQTRGTVWENAANKHARLFQKYFKDEDQKFVHRLPSINLAHIHRLTDGKGIIQFSDICDPDIDSGYTLDDNARAMIAMCQHFSLTGDPGDLELIRTYLGFIGHCQQADGTFLNYVDRYGAFHIKNHYTNLEDSTGRAIWALGFLIGRQDILPASLGLSAKTILKQSVPLLLEIESPRAMAFIIKGLYFAYRSSGEKELLRMIEVFANRMVDKYNAAADGDWKWFEDYLTYANSVLPEAMLYAYLATNKPLFKGIAYTSFEFLLSQTFKNGRIKVVSNRGWHHKGDIPAKYGEQPIDVSYTIQALDLFYRVFNDQGYREKMDIAYSWFLGNNHLQEIIYNPVSGGCYDGLEEHNVNLNQGAESTVCHLMARLTMEKMINFERNRKSKTPDLKYNLSTPASSRAYRANNNIPKSFHKADKLAQQSPAKRITVQFDKSHFKA